MFFPLSLHAFLFFNETNFVGYLELMATMKKLHEAFVSLCGRVHTVHSSLQNYKQEFLANRRRITGDTLDIFANKSSPSNTFSSTASTCKVASGPAPFGGSFFTSTAWHLINTNRYDPNNDV